jgi:hypothetical protein
MVNDAIASIAAKVDFASGNPMISDVSGQVRPAVKGSDIASGESVNTHQGIVQLRFTDGGKLSLQSDTIFRIDDYIYSGTQDGTERSFTTLIKGGLRTITGLIGKQHKESYKLSTTAATIGIRGTEFLVKFDDILEVHVVDGEVLIQNSAGTISLRKGHSARVVSETSPPQQTDTPPQIEVRTLTNPFNYSTSEDRTHSGTQSILSSKLPSLTLNEPTNWTISGNATPLASGQGYTIAHSMGLSSMPTAEGGMFEIDTLNNLSVSNDTTGLSTICLDPSNCFGINTLNDISVSNSITSLSTICLNPSDCTPSSAASGRFSVYSDSNADDIPDTLDTNIKRTFASYDNGAIGLGSWVSGTMWGAGWKNMSLGGFHYVQGLPTATMPTSGTATYSLVGATAPTYSHGNNILGNGSLTSASMTIDFMSNIINGNLKFSFTGGNYSTNFTGSSSASTFTANGNTVLTNGGSTNVCDTAGCSTQINGFFAGTSAKNAGLVYLIQSNQTFTINGAAVLQKPQ